MSYEGLVRIGADGERKPQWNGVVRFVEEHLLDPLKWKKPRRVFVNSMSDLFHVNVKDEWIDRIFAVMALCPQHTFQVLTKRPERMLEYLAPKGNNLRIARNIIARNAVQMQHLTKSAIDPRSDGSWPLPNVWLGVSVEDQATADERIPLLLKTPAAVRFVSAEPLLEELLLEMDWLFPVCRGCGTYYRQGWTECESPECDGIDPWKNPVLDWVICGGESGHGARPMRAAWAQDLRDQCLDAGTPFFFKQWGEWLGECQDGAIPGDWMRVLNANHQPIRVGKKKAGALLDGAEWRQFPEVQR